MDIQDIKFYKRMGTEALNRDKGLALITSASYFGSSILYAYGFMTMDTSGKEILGLGIPLILASGYLEARKYKRYKNMIEEVESYEEEKSFVKSR